jgi:hypothetical protein
VVGQSLMGGAETGAVRIPTACGEDTIKPANNRAAIMGARICGSGANGNEMLDIGDLDRNRTGDHALAGVKIRLRRTAALS